MYANVQKAVTNDFYENKWETPTNGANYAGNLVLIDGKQNSGDSFLAYIKSMQKLGSSVKPINKLVDKMYQSFVDEKMNTYYNDNLEKEFPEFNNIMEEYRDGLLLFDLMEKEIWEKSKTDTIGLKKFYDLNKIKYNWKSRLDIEVCSSTSEEMLKKAQKMFKDGKTIKEIKIELNTKDVINVMVSNGVYEEGSNNIPKGTKMKEGISDVTKNGEYYFVSKVNKVLPAGTKSLEDCKGKAINDYQQFLEENWISNLKAQYNVKVNNEVFDKIAKELQKK